MNFFYVNTYNCTFYQSPNFGQDLDGEAMENRLQRFNCQKLKSVDKSVKEKFRKESMAIIHWISSKLEGMDLFENPLNGNPPYVPIDFRRINATDVNDPEEREIVDLTELNTSILTPRVVEVSMFRFFIVGFLL